MDGRRKGDALPPLPPAASPAAEEATASELTAGGRGECRPKRGLSTAAADGAAVAEPADAVSGCCCTAELLALVLAAEDDDDDEEELARPLLAMPP